MTREEALNFLKIHQPMPDDRHLDKNLIDQYDEARKCFLYAPAVECIPLFLNSFGIGNGLGVYQLIDDVLKKYNRDEVVPHLRTSLNSKHEGVRYWSAQIASNFPSAELIKPLKNLLRDNNRDIRYATITALEQIGGDIVKDFLETHLIAESDEEIKELVKDVLQEL